MRTSRPKSVSTRPIAHSLAMMVTCLATWPADLFAQSNNGNNPQASRAGPNPLIVTARKIDEPVAEVPFGMTVLRAGELERERIHTTNDLFRQVPNFNYTDSGLPEANLLNIRGIGSSSTFLSPSVTYYVDGVPVPQRAFDQQFLDVERIEVLRGPQSTLFGQNSQAGAVRVLTKAPTDHPELTVSAEYGSFDELNLETGASGPLSDHVSGRVALRHSSRNGDIDNVRFSGPNSYTVTQNIRQRETTAVNGKLTYQPDGSTQVSTSGHMQRDHRRPTTGVLLDTPDYPQNSLSPRPDNDLDSAGGAFRVQHDFRDVSLTAITGYQTYDLNMKADITDGFIASATSGLPSFAFGSENAVRRFDEDISQWSQEFRLAGETASGSAWLVGLSGLYADFSSTTEIDSPALASGDYASNTATTKTAVFGEVTKPLSEQLRLIAGGRLSREISKFDSSFTRHSGSNALVDEFRESGETDDELMTGRLALSYDLTQSMTTFASVSRGAKAGGFPFFNQSAAQGLAISPYSKSSTWAYETGLKGYWLDDRLSFSGSLFLTTPRMNSYFSLTPWSGSFRSKTRIPKATALNWS